MFKNFNSWWIISVAVVIFSLLSFYTQGGGPNDKVENLLSVSSFLFGIFLAFSISNSYSRFSKLLENLRIHDGSLISLYKLTEVFGVEAKNKIRNLIDVYLVSQIDYFLNDFKKSGANYHRLADFILNLEVSDAKQETIFETLTVTLKEEFERRKLIEALIKDSMVILEWVSILILWGIILFCIFYLNDGSLVSILFSLLLSTSSVVLLAVLKELNDLRWKERRWIWDSLTQSFIELGLVPYFPEAVIKKSFAELSQGQRIRIAKYKNPYPDLSGKKVEIIEWKKR